MITAQLRFTITHSTINAGICAAMNTAMTYAVFDVGQVIPAWGSGGAATDLLFTILGSVSASVMMPALVAEKRVHAGKLLPLPRRGLVLPGTAFVRGLLLPLALVPPVVGVLWLALYLSEQASVTFALLLTVKLALGVAVGFTAAFFAISQALFARP